MAVDDVVVDNSKVDSMFLKLAYADGNELRGSEWLGDVWYKESGKCNVKGEKGFFFFFRIYIYSP